VPTKHRREADKMKMAGWTWFPFDVVDWLTSSDVMAMTFAERGMYVTLLCVQWRDGFVSSEPYLSAKQAGCRPEVIRRWFSKWAHLFPKSTSSETHLRNEKLYEIAVEKGNPKAVEGTEETREEERRVDLEEREKKSSLKEETKTTPVVLSSEDKSNTNPKSNSPLPPKACGCPDGLCDWAEEIPGCNVYPGSIGDAIYYQRHVKKNDYFIPKLTKGYVLKQWQRILNDTPEDFEYEAVPLFKDHVSHLEGGATHTSKVVQRRPKNAKERALLQQNISSNRQWLYDPACPNRCKEGYLDVSDYPDDPLFSNLKSTVICECVTKQSV
jgi:hypothetical protein